MSNHVDLVVRARLSRPQAIRLRNLREAAEQLENERRLRQHLTKGCTKKCRSGRHDFKRAHVPLSSIASRALEYFLETFEEDS